MLGEEGCNCLDLFRHHSACRKLDELVLNSDQAVLQAIYIWASATCEIACKFWYIFLFTTKARICPAHLNGMINDEFELLQEYAKSSKSPLKYKLFPRVFQLGMDQESAFIVMERLPGVSWFVLAINFTRSLFVRCYPTAMWQNHPKWRLCKWILYLLF